MSVYLYSFNVYLKYTLIKLLFICWLLVHLFYKSLKLLVEFVSLYCKRKDSFLSDISAILNNFNFTTFS